MLSWCAYCQEFIGETRPYDDFSISHSICSSCEPNVLTATSLDIDRALYLREIQNQLSKAGWRNDLAAAQQIMESAHSNNLRQVDILIGVVAPMLYQIGEDWKRGVVTVEDEHRFTAFCEKMFELVRVIVAAAQPPAKMQDGQLEILLINAPGNTHTLGGRILGLWLASKGIKARAIASPLDMETLVALISGTKPKFLLISVALAEQVNGVEAIVQRIETLPSRNRPKIIIGGHAVKMGLVKAIPGAELLADISTLIDFKEKMAAGAAV